MNRRPWLSIVALSACVTPLTVQGQTTLPPFSTFLKVNSSIQQIATDPSGNIYVVGEVPANDQDVFVAKLNPANAKITWIVYLGGSSVETAGGLAVDAAGNAYITGSTTSPDFPTTPQTTGPLPSDPSMPLPFAAKVSASGVIVYSTLFSNGASAVPAAIAVDGNGDAIISGIARETNFTTTPGAYNNPWSGNPPFVTKLDPTGTKVLFSVVGVGGSSIALDSANDIFVSGSTYYEVPSQFYPTTPGAFQTTFTPAYECEFLCQIGFSVPEQYITKLSADGSKLLYSTFLTGSGGSSNGGLAVDAAGDAWVTGETASKDYPYTASPSSNSRSQTFTTELDPTGSKVLLSVQQGGSSLSLDPQGNVVLAGTFPTYPAPPGPAIVNIPTPPGPPTGNIPAVCLPGSSSSILSAAFAMRISGNDGSVLGLQIIPGSLLTQISSTVDAQGNIYVAGSSGLPDIPLTSGFAFDSAVAQRTVYGTFLLRTNLVSPPMACVTDSTASTLIGPVAPGQLITLYGNGLGPTEPIVGMEDGAASLPTLLGGITIAFDGTPAPLLYVSANQINVQVPFSVQQSASTQMQVMTLNGSVVASRLFSVVPLNPSLFLDSGYTLVTCHNAQIGPVFTALALNQDGTVNSCANPAKAGSELSLFVDGLGVYAHNQVTGSLTSNPGYIATFAAVFDGYDSLEVDSFTDQPGAISGLGWIQVHVPDHITSVPWITLSLNVSGLEAGPFVGSYSGLVTGGTQASAVVFVQP